MTCCGQPSSSSFFPSHRQTRQWRHPQHPQDNVVPSDDVLDFLSMCRGYKGVHDRGRVFSLLRVVIKRAPLTAAIIPGKPGAI